jgi:hypothetical protein
MIREGDFMEKFRKLIIAIVVLLAGYYMYLTHVTQAYKIEDTYYASDEYSSIIMKFDGTTLSTYFLNPRDDMISMRTDYELTFKKYNEDIIGNFWSEDGIEPLGLRGSDVAGDVYLECIGSVLWPIDGDMIYLDKSDIQKMEEEENTSYSFVSRFAIKDNVLRVYDYMDVDFQLMNKLPSVDAEIVRLMDSLNPPKF